MITRDSWEKTSLEKKKEGPRGLRLVPQLVLDSNTNDVFICALSQCFWRSHLQQSERNCMTLEILLLIIRVNLWPETVNVIPCGQTSRNLWLPRVRSWTWTSYCIIEIVVLKEHHLQEEFLQTTAASHQMQSTLGYTFRLEL